MSSTAAALRQPSSLPRYASYPTAREFTEAFGPGDLLQCLEAGNGEPIPQDLALYVHLPFCRVQCWYCGCNRVVTRHDEPIRRYLDDLAREIRFLLAHVDPDRPVVSVQLGGGTPNVLDLDQLARLLALLHEGRCWAPDVDVGIELDPRLCTADYLDALPALGVTRVSFGVQDLDPAVQRAIHRIQPAARVLELVRHASGLGFASINCDLVYGLPAQSPDGLCQAIEALADAGAGRFALFEYAHHPEMFPAQRLLERAGLPAPAQAARMFRAARACLAKLGYVRIGMDHFARADDPLAQAWREGRLRRGFQGYWAGGEVTLLGFGASAISDLGSALAQNARTVGDWSRRVAESGCATARGVWRSVEDQARAAYIEALMCHGRVDRALGHRIDQSLADALWAEALRRLEGSSVRAHLLVANAERIVVTDDGMDHIRAVAAAFDPHRSCPA